MQTFLGALNAINRSAIAAGQLAKDRASSEEVQMYASLIIVLDSHGDSAHGDGTEAPVTVPSLTLPFLPSVTDSSVSSAPMKSLNG